MSGHSKWHNIRERKSKVDSAKGKIFTKIAREIMMAARQGGANPESNFRLRMALLKAKEVNIPKDNIERAIQKGSGQGGEEHYEELVYEGYGPSGAAILIEITTDNRNRTAAELRSLFSRYGGNLGESGCVAWMFDKKGLLIFDKENIHEENLLAAALEAKAEDLRYEDKNIEVYVSAQNFEEAKKALEAQNFNPVSAEISRIPKSTILVTKDSAASLVKLLNALEEHDDVQKVYSNFEMEESLLEELASS